MYLQLRLHSNNLELLESIDCNCILLYVFVIVVCSFYSSELNCDINSKSAVFICSCVAFNERFWQEFRVNVVKCMGVLQLVRTGNEQER